MCNKYIAIGKGDSISFTGGYTEKVEKAALSVGAVISDDGAIKVIVGSSDCTIPAVKGALEALSAIEKLSYYKSRYAVYAECGVIAIAYDKNEYTDIQSATYAAEALGEKIKAGEKLSGVVVADTVDLIEEQKKIDAGTKAEKWLTFKNAIYDKYGEDFGKRLYGAFDSFYAIFRDDLVEWYANLYEPSIGGMYASKSGKEHFGFLPLVESTCQGLHQLESFGVLPCSWPKSLPKATVHQIGYFAKSCQDPNGYFYHPQMAKAVTDAALNSRGRNLGWGVSLLGEMGMKPAYPTPRDDPYDGLTADEWWDKMVEEGEISPDEKRPFVPKSLYDYELWLAGKPTLKSKDEAMKYEVIPADITAIAPSVSTEKSNEYLESHKGFSDYLDSRDIDANPYWVASELNGTYRLIKAASDRLGKCTEEGHWYTGMTLCEMTIDWLNRHINAKGLFGSMDPDSDDPYEGVQYRNTNGLMKVIPIYNEWGIVYPEPLLAVKGCLMGVQSPEISVGNICETYNIWSAFSGVIGNVKKYAGEQSREETLAEVNRALGEYGPEAIVNCYVKQSRYQKPDGGFSHNIHTGTHAYQGWVYVGTGVNEANVDANGFGSDYIIRAMLSCFELSHAMPPMYYTWNYMRYLDILLGLKPQVKKVAENRKL